MSDKKPIVLGGAGQLQQVQSQDQIDPNTMPYVLENRNTRLIRMLVMDLMKVGFPVSQELINEASKGPN